MSRLTDTEWRDIVDAIAHFEAELEDDTDASDRRIARLNGAYDKLAAARKDGRI
jgi:hypothetical protein